MSPVWALRRAETGWRKQRAPTPQTPARRQGAAEISSSDDAPARFGSKLGPKCTFAGLKNPKKRAGIDACFNFLRSEVRRHILRIASVLSGKRMADDLKRSIEHLESPDCPNCRIKMKWYRSVRASQLPLVIDHFFQCENCGRIVQVRGDQSSPTKSAPPSQLSLPRMGQRPAA